MWVRLSKAMISLVWLLKYYESFSGFLKFCVLLMVSMEDKFNRRIEVLKDLFDFTSRFARQEQLNDSTRFILDLVVEELFVNMVKYNSGNSNDIYLRLSREGGKLTITFEDYDVDPFDITKRKAYDVSKPIEERRPGGVGIHLIRQVMDDIQFEYKNRISKITLTKNLESANVSG